MSGEPPASLTQEENESSKMSDEAETDIALLKDTELFTKGSLPHIFHGEVNRKGDAVGYHSEFIEDTPGTVIEGTRTKEDSYGVYTGQVEVDGIKKAGNRGYSSFFPKDWTPQQVVDGINDAYHNRIHDSGNTYLGETSEGVLIQMYLTDDMRIISAFPIYEGG